MTLCFKCTSCLVFAIAIGSTVFLAASTSQAQERTLVWQDEFDGNRLDYSKWECEVNAFGGGNDELQLYTDALKNVRVENGLLVLEAHREKANISGTLRDYSSGRIRSKHRGDWQYGSFEIRAKLPKGQGLWPAIWMLPTEEKYGGWAASGEIDIMEFKGQEPRNLYGSIHFGEPWPKNRFTTKIHPAPFDLTEDFHVYRIDWKEGSIEWLLDGRAYQKLNKWDSVGGKFPAPFDQPFHLILNLAVGGRFVGAPSESTPFPAKLEIDYVRVYK